MLQAAAHRRRAVRRRSHRAREANVWAPSPPGVWRAFTGRPDTLGSCKLADTSRRPAARHSRRAGRSDASAHRSERRRIHRDTARAAPFARGNAMSCVARAVRASV